MVRQFHDGMQTRVQNDGEFSEPFEVTNGVKEGCLMAPTLFSMMFSAMLMNAFQDSDTCFLIRYRFDGKIFNLRRLQAKTKMQTDVLDEVLYVDDRDKNVSSEAKMQRAMDQVSQSCDNCDLTISTKELLINSFTWEALFPEQCTLMMRSLPEWQKPVCHLEDSVQMSGSEMESSLTLS